MFSTHVLLIVIVCGTAFVRGGGRKRENVCRYSSDGPECRSDIDCNGPEVHCYKRKGERYGRCCVKRQYACPRGSNRFDDPEGYPPRVHRCLTFFPSFFCGPGYYCRTVTGEPIEFLGVCCPVRARKSTDLLFKKAKFRLQKRCDDRLKDVSEYMIMRAKNNLER